MGHTALSAVSEVLELRLPAPDGGRYSIAGVAGSTATAVIFVANGCPTVRAYWERLRLLQSVREAEGVRIVAVNANNPSLSPPDTVSEMARQAAEKDLDFPYLKDGDGALAHAFGAICTPHAFLLDDAMNVVYRGRIDDSRLGDRISSRDLDNAIGDVVAGRTVAVPETEPFGCGIVW